MELYRAHDRGGEEWSEEWVGEWVGTGIKVPGPVATRAEEERVLGVTGWEDDSCHCCMLEWLVPGFGVRCKGSAW